MLFSATFVMRMNCITSGELRPGWTGHAQGAKYFGTAYLSSCMHAESYYHHEYI